MVGAGEAGLGLGHVGQAGGAGGHAFPLAGQDGFVRNNVLLGQGHDFGEAQHFNVGQHRVQGNGLGVVKQAAVCGRVALLGKIHPALRGPAVPQGLAQDQFGIGTHVPVVVVVSGSGGFIAIDARTVAGSGVQAGEPAGTGAVDVINRGFAVFLVGFNPGVVFHAVPYGLGDVPRLSRSLSRRDDAKAQSKSRRRQKFEKLVSVAEHMEFLF